MRILLDENMPLDFGNILREHVVDHIESIGLKGTQNGKLLALAREKYDVLITLDRGILHQHRHVGPLIIIVVRVPNSIADTIQGRGNDVATALETAKLGDLIEIPFLKRSS